MKKTLLLFIWTIAVLSPPLLLAQERSISGRVTSADDGAPIPGVNIIIKGTTIGTVTDIDGNYKLSILQEGAVLVFTYIGMTPQEIEVGAQLVINIAMKQDVTQLTEIVVTAVGIQREARALGYSVENITGDKLKVGSEPDPLRELQGKVPGVNIQGSSGAPGSSTRITIRGNSSLLGNNEPLFVVDGIPFNNDENRTFNQLTDGGAYSSRIADLDPNNIQSITVLKGAAAAALYGSRAANGVIVVTTKTGNPNMPKKGLEMTYNSSYAWETIANLPKYQNTYGTGVNFQYQNVNGSWGPPFLGTKPYANLDSIPHWYASRPGMEAFNGVNVPYRAYPNNVKDLFQTGGIFDNSLNINAGNEKAALSVTLSNTTDNGYVPNTEFDRTSISAGGNAKLDNKFLVGVNISFIRTRQKGVQSGVGSLGNNNQSAFARALFLGRNWDVQGQPFQNPVDLGSEFMVSRAQADNPYWSYENAGFRSNVDRTVASINLGYDLLSWLNLSYKIGINTYNQRDKDFIRPGSTGASGLGRLTLDNTDFEEIESNFLITVKKDFSQDFSLKAILGHNFNQRTTNRQAIQGTKYVVFNIDDIDNMTNVIPFGGDYEQRRLFGVFGDVDLGYKDWAYLTLTGRNDWSSTLPIKHNSFFYPAVTGSVILTDALGIQGNFLRFFKARAGWSQVGNDTDPYQLQPVYLVNNYFVTSPFPTAQLPFTPTGGTTQSASTLSDIERDPNLKPEITSEIETGFESRWLNSRLALDVTVYKRLSKNQIAGVTLPDESGFSFLFTNFGEVSNKGVEIGLGLTPVKSTEGFEWNLYGTFTHNKNLVVKLRPGVNEITIDPGSSFAGSVSAVLRPGQEYGLLKGSVDDRDQDGHLLIDPSNGLMIRSLEPKIIGNPNPDFIVGLTNTFSYKGLTVNAVFDWRQGGDLYSNTVNTMLGRGVLKSTADREIDRIIPGVYGDPNTHEPIRNDKGEKIPNQTMVELNAIWFGESFGINSADEWAVFDATTFRLREITIGYDLPKKWLEKSPFGGINLSLSGRNLWYWAPNFPKDTHFDPEINQFGATNKQGIEYAATPSVKRYAVSLRATF